MTFHEIVEPVINRELHPDLLKAISHIKIEPDLDPYVIVHFHTRCDQVVPVSFHTEHLFFVQEEMDALKLVLSKCAAHVTFFEEADDLLSRMILNRGGTDDN